jgi:hypothetical protein
VAEAPKQVPLNILASLLAKIFHLSLTPTPAPMPPQPKESKVHY